ncbi:MAG TPA: trypsin-like peptidase domain-containing protein [Thermoanaerobaculia bacterium]
MSNTNLNLQDLSTALADTIAAASASLVQVVARRRRASSGVVWAADGLVVTADHTVEFEEDIAVGLADGTKVPARLVGRDPSTDLAVLRFEAQGLTPPAWSDLEGVRVGHLVLAVARPGYNLGAALGIVSDLRGEWRTPAGGRIDRYLQSAVELQRGFSGSLLVDPAGRAFGISSAGLLRGRNLTVPTATVRRVVESLVAHGRMRRGYLGIGVQPVRLPPPLAEAAGQAVGLIVVDVQPDGPAAQAGVVLGDVLLSLDGEPTADIAHLHGLLSEDRIGRAVALRLVRAGEIREVPATLGAR